MAMESKIRHDESVFFRLLAILIVLTILPSAVISYIIYSMGRSAHLEQTAVLLNSLAADRELTTRLLIEKQRDALGFLAKDAKTAHLARALSNGKRSTNIEALDQMVKRSPFFAGLSVIDTERGWYRKAGAFPQDMIDHYVPKAKQDQKRSFVEAVSLRDGERMLLIGQPIRTPLGNSGRSLMLGLIRLTIFDELYKNTGMLGTTGESFLSDSNGVALTTLRYSSHKENHPIDATAMQDCLNGNSKAFVITEDYVGVPTAMSYRPVEGYGGCVMVHIRASEVIAPIKVLRNMVLAIVATTITAVLLMAFLVMCKLLRINKERRRLENDLARHSSHMEAMVAERTVELQTEIKGRIDAELRLRENEAFLEDIVHNVHEVIFAVKVEAGCNFRFLWSNANGEKLIGARSADASGKTLNEVFGAEKGERLSSRYSECIRNGIANFEEDFNSPDDKTFLTTLVPVKDEMGRVYQILSSAMDITERKKLEAEMVKSQKLESLGVLAGGIAHDFNNLLAVMRLNISMLKHTPQLDADSIEMLELVNNSTLLATNLTNQLLTFAKGGKPLMKAVHVGELLRDVATLSLRGTKTTCNLELAEDLSHIEADRGQMIQVINNMLINADQAMPGGGVVTVSAENTELTGTEDKSLPLKQGKYVKIRIEDHGIGISEENLPRIFDPYFTTKKKGSGLGLASSYSIIKNHNGHISVSSSVGQGTVFEVFVPASARKESSGTADNGVGEKCTGRVLAMDDDDIVRVSVCKALRSLGYETDEASNGQEAVLKYKEGMGNGKPFDAVILDLTVPLGMGGEEAVKKILELDGSAKVFVSSGYSNTSVISNFQKYGFCGFLKKPYDTSELDMQLQNALAAKKT